jgi:putative ABC transport system permease protein
MLNNYVKMACRVLLRRKYFTFVSLFAISFTLMILMAATTVFDHQFGAMPPETRLDRTLCVMQMSVGGPHLQINSNAGYGFLNRYARGLPGVELMSIVGSSVEELNSYVRGRKFKLRVRRADGEFWKMMEFQFLEGGPLSEKDEKEASFVAVINEMTRQRLFGGEAALGRSLSLDGRSFRIAGVVANVPFYRMLTYADVWVPISTLAGDGYRTELVGGFHGLFLVRDTRDFPAIREEFAARLQRVEFPDPSRYNRLTGELDTYLAGAARSTGLSKAAFMASLLFLMVLFMVLPTLNLVSMNVSRILERSSEIGVRKAFGAASGTLVGQFITENVILTLFGGLLGLAGSALLLRAIALTGVVPYAEFHLNLRVFFAGVAVTLFFGVFSGAWPAWRMSRLHPVEALRGGMR